MPTIFELETLVTRLTGDATGLIRALTQAEYALARYGRQADTYSNAISRTIGGLFSTTSVAATALLGIGAAVSGVGFMAIRTSAQMEVMEMSFKGLIGSADQATQVLGNLKQLALETPFTSPDLINAAVELSAFGRSAEELLPDLRMIGDISRGNAQRFKEMTYIYGKIIEQGRLYQRDINQLAIRGVPIYLELARSLGMVEANAKKVPKEVMTQLRQLIQHGNIDSGMVEQIFKRITAPGGMFYGQTEAAMNTVLGLFSNVREQAYQTMRNLGDTLVSGLNLKPLLLEIGNVSRAFNEWLMGLSTDTKEAIRVVIAVTAAFVALSAVVTTSLVVWNLLTGNVLLIIGLITGLVAATSAWVVKMGGLEEAWYKIRRAANDFWDFIKPILPWIAVGITLWGGPLGFVIGAIVVLVRYWDELKVAAEEFYDFIRPTLTALWSLIKVVGFAIRDDLVAAWSYVELAAAAAYGEMVKLWKVLGGGDVNWTTVKEGIRDLVIFMEYSFNNINAVSQLAWEMIKYGAVVAADEIIKNFNLVPSVIIAGMLLLGMTIANTFISILLGVNKAVGTAVEAIWESIKQGKVIDIKDQVEKAFADAMAAGVKKVDEGVQEIKRRTGKVDINWMEFEGRQIPIGLKVQGLENLRAEQFGAVKRGIHELNQDFLKFRDQKVLQFAFEDAIDATERGMREVIGSLMMMQKQTAEVGQTAVVTGEQMRAAFQRVDATVFGSTEHMSRLQEFLRGVPTQEYIMSHKINKPLEQAPMPRMVIDGIVGADIGKDIVAILRDIDAHILGAGMNDVILQVPGLGM